MSGTVMADQVAADEAWLSPDRCARVAAFILALMPPLFALVTVQSVVSDMTVRVFSLPVVFAEGLIAWLAIRSGFEPIAAWNRLSAPTRIAATIWIAAVLVAAIFAWRDPVSSRIWAGVTLMHGLFAFALFDRLAQNWFRHRERLLDGLCFGLAAYVLVAVILALILWRTPDYPWTFFGIGVSNVRQVCFYGLPLVAIAASRISSEGAARVHQLQIAALTIGLFAVFWSGGRANLLAAATALAVAIALSERGARVRIAILSAGAALVAALLSIVLAPDPVFGAGNLVRFVPDVASGTVNDYSSSRLDIWALTVREVADQPLLGHAQGSFPSLLQERLGIFYNHPHNFLIQFPYELGLPGAAALLGLVCLALWRWPALYRREPVIGTVAASGLAGLTVNASLEGAFFHPLPVLCAIVFLTLVSASVRRGVDDGGPLRQMH